MYATIGVIELDSIDGEAVLALPLTEVSVRPSHAADEQTNLQNALIQNRPTTGPVASSWTGLSSRDVSGSAQTYALQFEKTNIWKIGWAKDAKVRCAEINMHIPHEHLNQQWKLVYTQNWASGDEAYRMEQNVLNQLDQKRTVGERLRCDQS